MKTFTDGKYLDKILNYMDRLQKVELAIEALPKKFTKECSERKDAEDQRKQLEYEIVQIQAIIKNQLSGL